MLSNLVWLQEHGGYLTLINKFYSLYLFKSKLFVLQVYAVEASNLAKLCADIVSVNGFSDVIEVVHSRVEDAVLPIEDLSADVIVSEWMGFYLLHEAMLSSVIYARDKWLKADGILVPSVASIYMSPVNMGKYVQENINIWENAYGFNFTPLKKCIQEKHLVQPLIETVDAKACLAPSEYVTHLHLKYVAKEDLHTIRRHISFQLNKNSVCHGFCFWFCCKFEASNEDYESDEENNCVILDTGPAAPPTHWKQTIVLLPEALLVNKGDSLVCKLELQQDRENMRRYNISVELDEEEDEEEDDPEDTDIFDGIEDEKMKDLARELLIGAMQN